MKLRDLDAHFLKLTGKGWQEVDTLAEAQAVRFLCPKCFAANGGPVGTHIEILHFANRGVPDDRTPGPGRWNPEGTSLDDLTFVGPGAFSVASACPWHGFVEHGEVNIR